MAGPPQEPPFIMHGARWAIAQGLSHIEEQVKALEKNVAENTGLVFDLARTLIESTCKTIISDRSGTYDKHDKLPKLFKTACQLTPFLPPELAADAEARKSLEQTLNGLHTALQGICELRNAFGFASHGSEGPRPVMDQAQAILAAQAADAIIGFLYQAHIQDLARPRPDRLRYEDNPDFNEWLDDENGPVQILTLPPYSASEVLFNVDLEAYQDLLSDYRGEVEAAQIEEEGEAAA